MLNQAFSVSRDSSRGNTRMFIVITNHHGLRKLLYAGKLVSGAQKWGLVSYSGRHTRQELVVLWLPHSFLLALFMSIAAGMYEPRFKTLPISLAEERSPLVVALWVVEEFWYLAALAAICVLGATTHALCFEKFLADIKAIRTRATTSR